MAHFKHQFVVNAPLEVLWKLHDDPQALVELTPPPIRVKLLEKDNPLQAGSKLKFRMFLIEPLGVTWLATYDQFTPYQQGMAQCGFVDRSLKGPFHSWRHEHTFKSLSESQSTVTDEAHFELIGGPLGKVVSWLIGFPAVTLLFLFRRFKTRQMIGRLMSIRAAEGEAR